ncbi:MAG: SH3 domain-containing protein [Bdellovibrionaceae bacterium]|nr:SH3 domain-containing protein [Pseudobdellovibrionaceae bacterium]MBX3033094.1 SH3 domain-containing protein [Pseudobdellovibrionaceae bacterium]
MKTFLFLSGPLVLAVLVVAPARSQEIPAAPSREVRAIGRSVNILDEEGDVVCSVRRGTSMKAVGRHVNEEDLQVQVSARNCKTSGPTFIDRTYVRPLNADGSVNGNAVVDTEGLNFRSRPSANSRAHCTLHENQKVQVIDENPPGVRQGAWVKIRLSEPASGCPDEGFVNTSYLTSTDTYQDLPLTGSQIPLPPPRLESGLGCATGECGKENKNIDQLGEVVGPQNLFVDELQKLIKKPSHRPRNLNKARGMVQLPLCSKKGFIGPFNSFHYDPASPGPVGADAYANPLTACAFSSVLHDWDKQKAQLCPAGSDCQIAWGDISHPNKKRFNGHKSHTRGQCIDIRPIMKGGFSNEPLCHRDVYRGGGKRRRLVCSGAKYDRATTQKFVAMLKERGGEVIFNDPSIKASRAGGHDNHIHVCFNNNANSRKACDNFKPTTPLCPVSNL